MSRPKLITNKRAYAQVAGNKRKAKLLGVESTLTYQEWLAILKKAKGICAYCKHFVGDKFLVIEHMVPLSKGGANSTSNITAACAPCNSRKKDNLPDPKYNAVELPLLNPDGYYDVWDLARARGAMETSIQRSVRLGHIKPVGRSTKNGKALLFDEEGLKKAKIR